MTGADRLAFAQVLSKYAHAGQVDKAGKSYYLHPLAVSEKVESTDEKIVALLHDVLEDTFVNITTIRNLFGPEIGNAVRAISRMEGEPYDDFIERLSKNELAKRVKMADLEHNMDLSRLPVVTDRDKRRFVKYKKALHFLQTGVWDK